MALQTCWRCLSRTPFRSLLPQPQLPPPLFVASFTTTSLQFGQVLKKKGKNVKDEPKRGVSKNFKRKKEKRVVEKSKKPAVGERKALRKRIVLSNTNALDVPGIQNISMDLIVGEKSEGQIVSLPGSIVDRLREVDAFKVSQGWKFYRRPCMLVRSETVEYGRLLEEMSKENAIKKTIRKVLVGERGSGKSLLLLQTMAMAFLKDWIIINIPDGKSPPPLHSLCEIHKLTELAFDSPGACDRPYGIWAHTRHLPHGLQPKSLHFLPPRLNRQRQSHPLKHNPLNPSPSHIRPNQPIDIPLPALRPRRLRRRNRPADLRNPTARPLPPRATANAPLPRRPRARDESLLLPQRRLQTHPRPRSLHHEMVPRFLLRSLPSPQRRHRPSRHLRLQQPRHPHPRPRHPGDRVPPPTTPGPPPVPGVVQTAPRPLLPLRPARARRVCAPRAGGAAAGRDGQGGDAIADGVLGPERAAAATDQRRLGRGEMGAQRWGGGGGIGEGGYPDEDLD